MIIIINPKLGDRIISSNTDSKMSEYNSAFEQNEKVNQKGETSKDDNSKNSSPCTWKFYPEKKNDELYNQGYRLELTHQKVIKNLTWHPRSDYFATVLDDKNSNSSVIMHQLSKQKSVRPFAKMNGIVQQVVFHPSKPILFVAVTISYSIIISSFYF